MKSNSNTRRGITPTVRKQELSFFYTTCHLFLFYISTKYYQNILRGIHVTEQTRNQIQTQEGEITLKVKKPKLSFLYVTVLLSYSTFLPSIIKTFQRVFDLRAETKSMHNHCQI